MGGLLLMIYIIFVILIIIFFLILLAKISKKKNIIHVLYALEVLVIVLFVAGIVIDDLNQRSSYDKSIVTLKENEKIDVEIVDVNDEQIQVQIKNNDSTNFRYTDYFLCMKKQHGKWKYMKFGWNTGFSKCVYELGNGQRKTRNINWKDYFGHKLKRGEYRLIWIDELEFEID
jgi:energy-coupling factor transporter transmembrane protein EcfT